MKLIISKYKLIVKLDKSLFKERRLEIYLFCEKLVKILSRKVFSNLRILSRNVIFITGQRHEKTFS